MELAFHTHNGLATCASFIGRNVETLLVTDLHPMGETEIWTGNKIAASIASKTPIRMDAVDCPAEKQPFPSPTRILYRLAPLGNIKYTNGSNHRERL
jgi:hypothetical protein